MEKSRVIVCVTHGVPAHNPFLHMFEADKDVVYLDYSAVTIVEKSLLSHHMMTIPIVHNTDNNDLEKENDDPNRISNFLSEFTGLTPLLQPTVPERTTLEKN